MGVDKKHQVADPVRTQVEDSEEIVSARAAVAADPESAEAWMNLGLALARAMYMRESVEAYSRAIALEPFRGILYRYRGHRHISCWEFSEAAADFEMAARLIPENWDVWYHLGLSYYLMKEYDKAQVAYSRCLELTDMNDVQSYPAVIDWSWRTARRRKDDELASHLLSLLPDDLPYDQDTCGYALNCGVYLGRISPEDALDLVGKNDWLHSVTNLYAIGNYYREMGDDARSDEVLDRALSFADESYWSAFGYLAAAVDRGLI